MRWLKLNLTDGVLDPQGESQAGAGRGAVGVATRVWPQAGWSIAIATTAASISGSPVLQIGSRSATSLPMLKCRLRAGDACL